MIMEVELVPVMAWGLTTHSQLNVLPAKQWHSQLIADARAQHASTGGAHLKLLGNVPQGAKVS